jgi:hypothetical protein
LVGAAVAAAGAFVGAAAGAVVGAALGAAVGVGAAAGAHAATVTEIATRDTPRICKYLLDFTNVPPLEIVCVVRGQSATRECQ